MHVRDVSLSGGGHPTILLYIRDRKTCAHCVCSWPKANIKVVASVTTWFVSLTMEYIALDESASADEIRSAIHQFLRTIFKLSILVLLAVSTLSYVVKVKNHS
jgi:hypothetical protein